MDELRFDGRTAIVTGAGGNPGLGRCYALLLASRGANVVVNDIGSDPESENYASAASAAAVAEEIRDAGGNAVADTHSVADEAGAAALVQTALEAFGTVDIVVNNAAISMMAAFDQMTSRDIMRHLEINLLGPMWVSRAAWPHMKARRYGRIVNAGSGAMVGLEGFTAYGASKGGVFALTRCLAVEGARCGIKVNTIHPAAHTRMLASVQDEGSSLLIHAQETTPAERVAPVVALLCHESCPVTGQTISAAGGFVNRTFVSQTEGVVFEDITIEAVADRWEELADAAGAAELPASEIDIGTWKLKPYRGQPVAL